MLLLILFLILGWHVLGLVANWLNGRSLSRELPESFRGVYDEDQYARLQDYNRANTRLELLASVTGLAALLLFWFGGGFPALDALTRRLGFGPVGTGLCYIGALALGSGLVQLPFSLWHTFVIEARFGFNKTTWRTWLADRIKSLLLGTVLGGGLLALVLTLFQHGSALAWLYGWIITSLFMLLMAWLGPTFIMPLFNKFTPLEEGELRRAILDLAKKEDFPLADISVMDGSRRSTKSNAFFTGLGKTQKIALFDTLIAQQTVEELVAVLAHEIGHYKLGHIPRHLALSIINLGLFFLLAGLAIKTTLLTSVFGLEPSVYAGLVAFWIVYGPFAGILGLATSAMSRRHEFEADRFAAAATGNPGALVQALQKLSKANLSNLKPHWLYVLLYHSHPPVLERIAALNRS